MTKRKVKTSWSPCHKSYEDHGKPKPKCDFSPRELRHKTLDEVVGGWAARIIMSPEYKIIKTTKKTVKIRI